MVVNDNDNGLQCDSCKSWYHAKCQNVSDNDNEIMDSLPADLLNWFGHNCKPSVSKLLKVVTDISDRCDTIESNVAALDTRVTELETKDNESSDTMRDLVQGECKKLLFEERDKTRRKSNIIIHGLSEPTSDNEQGKIDEDKAKVLNICINELGLEVNQINIKSIFRLNSNSTEASNTRPRLLKVILGDPEERNLILQRSKVLANPEDPNNKVHISPDLNREERAQNTKLVNELYTKRQ